MFIVVVRKVQKEKLRDATSDGFALKRVRNDKVDDVSVAFVNAKSIKLIATAQDSVASKIARAAGWMVLGELATLGIIFGVLLAARAGN